MVSIAPSKYKQGVKAGAFFAIASKEAVQNVNIEDFTHCMATINDYLGIGQGNVYLVGDNGETEGM